MARWHSKDLIVSDLFDVSQIVQGGHLRADQPLEALIAYTTLVLIHLGSALDELEEGIGQRCDITGPDIMSVGRQGDLHSLIKWARAAACHPNSRKRELPFESANRPLWVFMPPANGWFEPADGWRLKNPYSDDTLVAFATVQFFIVRNLFRCFDFLCGKVDWKSSIGWSDISPNL